MSEINKLKEKGFKFIFNETNRYKQKDKNEN